MPTYHRFDGLRIEVRSRDHGPPRFPVIGPDFHALIDIRSSQVIQGTYTRKPLAEVVAWASGRSEALMREWRRLNERG